MQDSNFFWYRKGEQVKGDPQKAALTHNAGMLACRNRAQLAFAAYQNDKLDSAKSIGQHESNLPAPYFIEKLRRLAGGTPKDAPEWANNPPIEMVPIEQKVQFLRNACGALNLTRKAVAEATAYAESTIRAAEQRNDVDQVREACLKHYIALAKERGLSDLINRAAYDKLIDGPVLGAAERVKAQRAAGKSDGLSAK